MEGQVLAFILIAALLTVTPGADMALVTRQTLAGGRRAAFYTTIGIGVGCLVHAMASAVGVSVILARSARAFDLMKLVGAAYLAYLGAGTLWKAGGTASPPSGTDGPASEKVGRWFAQGCLTNLLNPKVALFYLTFLPQFVSPRGHVLGQTLLLGGLHVSMGLVWLTAYAAGIDRFARACSSARVKRRMERVTGAVLVALGIRLALARR